MSRVCILTAKAQESDAVLCFKVSSKYKPALHDRATRDVSASSATLGDHVTEPVVVQSAKQTTSFLLPSELLIVDDAVQDFSSGMLKKESRVCKH